VKLQRYQKPAAARKVLAASWPDRVLHL